MATPQIPSVEVRAIHREVGRQIGEALRGQIHAKLKGEVRLDCSVRAAARYTAAALPAARPEGAGAEDMLRLILPHYDGAFDCHHPDRFAGDDGKTVFSLIADIRDKGVAYGRGNPRYPRAEADTFATQLR